MARTFPSVGVSPVDVYMSNPDRPLFFGGMTATANTSSMNGIWLESSVGEVTVDSLRGIFIYLGTCTTAPSIVYGIDIGIVGTGLSTNSHFIRMYNHGTDALTSVFCLDNAAQDIATYLFKFGASELAPCSAGSDSTNCTNKIAIDLGGATRYLHVFSD